MEHFEHEISIPQAKSLLGRGVWLDDEIYLIDNITEKNLPKDDKETKCFVILLCEEGKIRFDTNGQTIIAEKNNIIILSMGQKVSNYKVLSPIYRGKAIFVNSKEINYLTEDFCNAITFKRMIDSTDLIKVNDNIMTDYENLFVLICHQLTDKSQKNKLPFALNLAKIIFQLVLEKCSCDFNDKLSQEEKLFNSFSDYVQENVLKHLTVTQYCKDLEISMTHLENIVQKYKHQTPKEYINEKLLNYICIISECTTPKTMPMWKIAEFTHFNSPSALAKFFKRHLKMTLTDYQKLLKAGRQLDKVHYTTLDQIVVLKALPKIYTQEYLASHPYLQQPYRYATCCS